MFDRGYIRRGETYYIPNVMRNPSTDRVEPSAWREFLNAVQNQAHPFSWACYGAKVILEHINLGAAPGLGWWGEQFAALHEAISWRPKDTKNQSWYRERTRDLHRYEVWLDHWAQQILRKQRSQAVGASPEARRAHRRGLAVAQRRLAEVMAVPEAELSRYRKHSALRWRRRIERHARWLLADALERRRNTRWRNTKVLEQSRVEFWHAEAFRLEKILQEVKS